MKNNKGLTLIEIIVSIALLGVICTMMMPNMVVQFRLMAQTRQMTQNAAEAQQALELKISEVNKAIEEDDPPDDSQNYTIFAGKPYETTVKGYPREVDFGSAKLYTVVASYSKEDFPVASITDFSIWYSDGDKLEYGYTTNTSLYVDSKLTLHDPKHVNMTNLYRWYVSRPGFNMPVYNEPEEIEKGTKYPRFPYDYTIISGKTASTLPSVTNPNYAGRHLIATVTPASNSGKMGTTVLSNPLFVCGLPFTDDMQLHLDASMIPEDDLSVVRIQGSSAYIKKWHHIPASGELSDSNKEHATQGDNRYQAELKDEKIGEISYDGYAYDTYVKFLRFETGDYMETQQIHDLSSSNRTTFVVAKEGSSGEFVIYNEPADIDRYISVNSQKKVTIKSFTGSISDIAEIIIYNGSLTVDETKSVMDYLTKKYQPVTTGISIYKLNPVTETVVVGSAYTKPSTVPANMTNGTVKNVAVNWTGGPVDTSKTGTYVYTGTSVSDPSKTTTLTVHVVYIKSIEDIEDTVEQNALYIFRDYVAATLSNDTLGNVAVLWDSSHVDTGTVGSSTVIMGRAVLDPTKTVKLTVRVVPISVNGLTLNKDSTTIRKGMTEQLTATVSPANAYNKTVNWVSSNTSVATVTSSGLVTAIGKGTAVIKAASDDNSSIYDTCTVNVTVPITGIEVIPSAVTVSKGHTYTLTAKLLPAGCDSKPVTWSKTGNGKISVDANTGIVTVYSDAKYFKQATITARVTDEGDTYTDTCIVTVGIPVTGVTLNKSEMYLDPGDWGRLYETIAPDSDGVNDNVSWSSSNASVATVDEDGWVYGIKRGTADITVTTVDGGYTATCRVTVGIAVTSITLDKTTMDLYQGKTGTLKATVKPDNATDKTFSWTTSNGGVATVNSSGTVTAVGPGTAVITATTSDGGLTATCTVNVRTIPVTGVDLDSAISVKVGDTHYMKDNLRIIPADATNQVVSWSSGNNGIAAIDASTGLLTAKSVGTTIITVRTNDGGFTDTCTVTVNPVLVDKVTLNKNNVTIKVGETFDLTATVSPPNATNKSISWTSSNTSVATVDSTGRVTAISKGTAVITAKTSNPSVTAACTVKVNPPFTADYIDGNQNWFGIEISGTSVDEGSASISGAGNGSGTNTEFIYYDDYIEGEIKRSETVDYSEGVDYTVIITDNDHRSITVVINGRWRGLIFSYWEWSIKNQY